MRHLAFTLVMAAPAFAFAAPAFQVDFRNDGSVHVGDQEFSSVEEFHSSDYFRNNGLRCGSVPRVPQTDALYAMARFADESNPELFEGRS